MVSMKKVFRLLFVCCILNSCSEKQGSLFHYIDSEKTGLDFSNDITETKDLNILDYLYFYNGGGVAVGDINNDGLADIFLSANQKKNKLYLNRGDLKFEDITEKAGVEGSSDWNTGAVMADINGDGWMDIYVTAVVGINGFDGYNELYINNQDGSFTEKAAQYGLDFDTYSSSAAFLDYDMDGDLDLYLLNHAVHTQKAFGKAELRNERNYETGDRLMRNDGDKFIDVSEEAGIFGGVNGYGLGIAIADFNRDGYPDIYVGNDFHEDDYYYLNNGNGTFTESLKDYFGHTTRFSMGNDVADINNDGWPDLMSLDMLPEDEEVIKASEGDDSYQTLKMRTEGYGYHYQYTRNMLHLNRGDHPFSESALLSGIAATDWSWSTLIEDYNNDGKQDVFVANGIPKRPNDLDFIKFVSSEQIQNKINETKLVDQEALELMPAGKVSNYLFEGGDGLSFNDQSGEWIKKDSLVSGATAFADLDLDGDLDLVVNNLNSEVSLLENKSENNNYLSLEFRFLSPNSFGIGTKAIVYSEGELQYKELYTVRGFQASSEPIVHFGLGDRTVDSLLIVWPNKRYELLIDPELNNRLTLTYDASKTKAGFSFESTKKKYLFKKVENNLGLDFVHEEDAYLDFNRQKLIPYMYSNRGPGVAVGDLNGDKKQDLFFGGSKFKPAQIFFQKDSVFVKESMPLVEIDSVKEIVGATIFDINGDGANDLFTVSAGADFFGKSNPLQDSYYLKTANSLVKTEIEDLFHNASVVREYDFDQDGDKDVFIGNNIITSDFGNVPPSYLLINENGNFSKDKTALNEELGIVSDAIWSDFSGDGIKDLIVIGEWMSPRFFRNESGELKEVDLSPNNLNGLWQKIAEFDIDNDGDLDYMLGNWGLNSKFIASEKHPLRMYYSDFDNNGATETIVAYYKNGDYYPMNSFDELSSQIVSLRKKFTSYKDFAGVPMDEVFDKEILDKSEVYEVHQLASGFLRNENGKFEFVSFDDELQMAPIKSFLTYDFDNDDNEELLVAGNFFGTTPYHGRFDSFPGALMQTEDDWALANNLGLDLTLRSVRHLSIVMMSDKPYLLVTFNNEKAEFYHINP